MCARERNREQNSVKGNDILTATITNCCCQYITWLRRNYFENNSLRTGDRGGTVVKVLRYKSKRSLVRFQMVSLEFLIDIILPIAL